MERKVSVICLLCGLFLEVFAASDSKNALPYRLTYESQLLEKMIRMEIQMEEMEGRMNKTQEAVDVALEHLILTLDNKTDELKEIKEQVYMLPVAFYAIHPQDQSLDTAQKLIMQTVKLNLGGGYDSHLGLFTAPVSGLYQFSAHMCTYSNVAFHYYIELEGTAIAESTKHNTAAYDCSSCSVITQVVKDQRVWIQSSSSSGGTELYESSYRRSSFSGILLHN